MTRNTLLSLTAAGLLLTGATAMADTTSPQTGTRIKQLPKIIVNDTANKQTVQDDDADLSPELQAILAEAEATENAE
ncbi:MAG: hypothetical protein AAF610_00800 [Pseudomonadota bacterium]